MTHQKDTWLKDDYGKHLLHVSVDWDQGMDQELPVAFFIIVKLEFSLNQPC